jgi:hypothetical protein
MTLVLMWIVSTGVADKAPALALPYPHGVSQLACTHIIILCALSSSSSL